MSTILKALHRLERDKHAQKPRPLREEVASASLHRRRSLPVWVPVSGAVGGGIAVAFGALLLAPERAGPPEGELARPASSPSADAVARAPVAPSAARRAPSAESLARGEFERPERSAASITERTTLASAKRAATRASQPRAAPEPESPELPAAALRSPVEVVERIERQPRAREARPAATAPQARAIAEGPPKPLPGAEPSQKASESAPEPVQRSGEGASVREPAMQAARGEAAPRELARAPGSEAAVEPPPSPFGAEAESPAAEAAPSAPPHELSTASPRKSAAVRVARAPVPSVFVAQTIWHPLAERRQATVELEDRREPVRLREGDAVGPLVVDRIEPSGVVFSHEGVELRRRVGAR